MSVLSAADGTYKFDLFIAEWRSTTRGWPLEMRGLFIEIVVELFKGGGYLPSDPKELADVIDLDARPVARLLPKLIARRELAVDADGRLYRAEVLDQLDRISERKARCAARTKPAAKPAPTPAPEASPADFCQTSAGSPADLSDSVEEKQDVTATPFNRQPSTVDKEEVGAAPPPPPQDKYVFQGETIRLNAKDYARLEAEHPAIPNFRVALNVIDADVTEKGGRWWYAMIRKLGYMQLDYEARRQNVALAAKAKPNPQADRRFTNRVVDGKIVVRGVAP